MRAASRLAAQARELVGSHVAPGVTNAVTPSAGVATTPRATLTATNLDFGNVLVGTSKTLGMLVSTPATPAPPSRRCGGSTTDRWWRAC